MVWAAPWTIVGALLGLGGVLGGGSVRRDGRVLEFWGGPLAWFLRTFPLVRNASAVTFGHAILARDRAALERCRAHERVHVRQYERWGPLFVPAYILCWCWMWTRGRHPYYDNPFEKEALGLAP